MRPVRTHEKTVFQVNKGHVWLNSKIVSPMHLRVTQPLGEGANGVVYEATDIRLQRTVALKLWHPSVVLRRPNQALEETRKNASIDHPSFVTVHDFGTTGNVPFMIMQLVRGQSAKNWLRKDRPFDARHCIWTSFSEAIHVAYSQGLLHGDPHTGNILISDGTTNLKLVDMGTSRLRSSRADFTKRESAVLRETCERLFPEDSPTALLDERSWEIPQITLAVLDAYVQFLSALHQAADQSDDHQIHSNGIYLSILLLSTPLFRLEVAWQRILRLNINEDHRAFYLGSIDAQPQVNKLGKSTIKPIDTKSFPEVLKRYRAQSNLWWRQQIKATSPPTP